jgi:hypothetical protein
MYCNIQSNRSWCYENLHHIREVPSHEITSAVSKHKSMRPVFIEEIYNHNSKLLTPLPLLLTFKKRENI